MRHGTWKCQRTTRNTVWLRNNTDVMTPASPIGAMDEGGGPGMSCSVQMQRQMRRRARHAQQVMKNVAAAFQRDIQLRLRKPDAERKRAHTPACTARRVSASARHRALCTQSATAPSSSALADEHEVCHHSPLRNLPADQAVTHIIPCPAWHAYHSVQGSDPPAPVHSPSTSNGMSPRAPSPTFTQSRAHQRMRVSTQLFPSSCFPP